MEKTLEEKRLRELQLQIAHVATSDTQTGMGSNLNAGQAAMEVAKTSGWKRAIELFFAR